MPKVLRIINRFNLGGPTYNVAYLTKHLPAEYETLLIGGPEEEGETSSLHITDSLGLKPIIIESLNREIDLKKDLNQPPNTSAVFFAIQFLRSIEQNRMEGRRVVDSLLF